jgi:plastocyanin
MLKKRGARMHWLPVLMLGMGIVGAWTLSPGLIARTAVSVVEARPFAADSAIEARDYSFSPSYPVVPVGTTVTWTNFDDELHSVTSEKGLFNGEIAPGASFSYRFDKVGFYFYYCTPHDWMIGEIEVTGDDMAGDPPDASRPVVQPTGPSSADVTAIGYEFLPMSVVVAPGGAVTWVNFDPEQHLATALDGSWSTTRLSGGQSDTLVFAESGIYEYQCSIHPSMQGAVLVGV